MLSSASRPVLVCFTLVDIVVSRFISLGLLFILDGSCLLFSVNVTLHDGSLDGLFKMHCCLFIYNLFAAGLNLFKIF